MIDDDAVDLALRAQLETIAELPTARSWESVDFKPDVNTEYATWDYVPGATKRDACVDTQTSTGVAVVGLYFLANQGNAAIRETIKAIRAAFPIGLGVPLDCGQLFIGTLTGAGPSPSQILPYGKNKVRCMVTIPWYLNSLNSSSLN